MGTIESNDQFFIISGQTNDKVNQELNGVMTAHNDILNFIYDSAKQMAAFLQTDHNESRILRTPSRRTSKRKRSSVALKTSTTAKKAVSSALKTRDVSAATPRRFSKRAKRSTVKLDTTIEEMDVQTIQPVVKPITDVLKDDVLNENICETICLEVIQPIIEVKAGLKDGVKEDIVLDNNVMTASELMSELSIKEDINKDQNKNLNESDTEWMTDDEECPKNMETEEFFDAIAVDGNKDGPKEVNHKMDSSVVSAINKTLTASSAAKEKRKKSLYFTPQTTQRSTRAQTRMLSRIADSSQRTPQTASKNSFRVQQNTNMVSNESQSKQMTGSSSSRSQRSYSRIQSKIPDNKALTDSALKKRQEAEEQRRQKLMASVEKEKKAMEKRRILIQKTVNEKKLKSQEKANKAAELRELHKQKESEKLRKEMEKREEWERKREEERREQMRRRQEEMIQKSREIERRKQLQEVKELEAKVKKQEELTRKQEQEKERHREQEKMAALIQQHNNSLQQKALANSFIKKCETNTQLLPKVVINKLSPAETAKHLKVSPEANEPKAGAVVQTKDQTFVVTKDESKDTSSYDMTPPPKEHDYDNYDISQIQSDDDTDDEQQPRKRIPVWARGQEFIKQVHQQYSKPQKLVYREVKAIFGSGDVLLKQFGVDFDLMFQRNNPLHPRYQKRTSSAVWESPPTRYRLNESSINESFL